MNIKLFLIFIILTTSLFSEIIWEVDYDTFGADYANIGSQVAILEDEGFALTARLTYNSWWDEYTLGFLAKFNAIGELLWSDYENTTNFNDGFPNGIIEIDNDQIITAGIAGFGNQSGYVTRRNSEGEIVWQLEMPDLLIKNLLKLDSSSFVVIGFTYNPYSTSAIRKIDSQGNIIWTRFYEMGANWSRLYNSTLTSDGNIALIGARYYNWSTAEAFTIKISADGDSLWTQIHPESFNECIFESSENKLIVLGRNNTFKLDLSGNILASQEGVYDYGIDLPNENNFLARNDEYGSANQFDIFQFDYDLNSFWLTDEYFKYYFVQLSDNGFLFFKDNEFHFIRTNEDFVNATNELIPELSYFQIQNYPNPFNPSTTIEFALKETGNICLEIYNIKGQKVKQFIRDQLSAGQQSVVWDGRDENNKPVSSGIYLYKLEAGDFEKTRKMILMK